MSTPPGWHITLQRVRAHAGLVIASVATSAIALAADSPRVIEWREAASSSAALDIFTRVKARQLKFVEPARRHSLGEELSQDLLFRRVFPGSLRAFRDGWMPDKARSPLASTASFIDASLRDTGLSSIAHGRKLLADFARYCGDLSEISTVAQT